MDLSMFDMNIPPSPIFLFALDLSLMIVPAPFPLQ
jgi:hypothetical protein